MKDETLVLQAGDVLHAAKVLPKIQVHDKFVWPRRGLAEVNRCHRYWAQ
jgi:hypothetical protein